MSPPASRPSDVESFPNATPTLLAALDAEYPSWRAMSREAFDAFRRTRFDRTADQIRLAVARLVFATEFEDSDQLDAFCDRPPHNTGGASNLLHEMLLPLEGEGTDSFIFNEHFSDGEGTWTFPTLRAYDESNHWYQEKQRAERGDGDPRPYLGRMLWDWAKWIQEGHLVYGTLSVAAFRLAAECDRLMSDTVEAAFDFTFVHMNKLPADTMERVRAVLALGGKRIESMLDERWKPYFLDQDPWVIAERNDQPGERNLEVTFSGPAALDSVRPNSFLADLATLPDGSEMYAAYADREKAKFQGWLEETVRDARMDVTDTFSFRH